MNTLKSFNQDLSWNTKFYVLLASIMLVFAFFTEDTNNLLLGGSALALLSVWIVDYYKIVSRNYPKMWRIVKLIIISSLVILIILGNSNYTPL